MKYIQQKIPTNKKKRKTNKYDFSTSTGTKCRNKTFEKMLNDTKNKYINNYPYIEYKKRENLIKHLENKIENKSVKLTDKYILNEIRNDLENGKICNSMRSRIKRTTDDDIIMELNKDKLKSYRKNLFTLILSMNRKNIPLDIIEVIKDMGLKLIVPETNIYKIIPDNLLIDILKINKLEKEYNDSIYYFFHDNKIMNEKKSKILEKYSGESKIYYGFIECIFMNISKRYSKYYRGLDDLLDDLFITPRRFFGNEYYDLNNFLINF